MMRWTSQMNRRTSRASEMAAIVKCQGLSGNSLCQTVAMLSARGPAVAALSRLRRVPVSARFS